MNFLFQYFRILLTLSLFLIPSALFAQKNFTLSGYVKDAQSGEALVGASIYIEEAKTGMITNVYGFYSVTLPAGTYHIQVQNLGYNTVQKEINLVSNQQTTFEIWRSTTIVEEVTITATKKEDNVGGAEMGTTTLSVEKIKKLPVIFGETDIMKAVQLLPGVQSAGEGNSGFYVRGGGPDQNLVLLDDAVVYNTGHLFGFFSIFNADALKNVTLIKGGMPANYGGRLSSVLDVSMKEGNNKSYHAEGGIGLIASRLTFEGPIVKDKGSFIVSGRRTYVDVISKPFLKKEMKGSGYYFYDMNLKANYQLGEKDRIYLSGYFGKDVFDFSDKEGNFKMKVPWGNSTATMRWNHQFGPKVFLNTTAVYNDYDFKFNAKMRTQRMGLFSGIRDWNMKSDLDYYYSLKHHIKLGLNYTWHTFTPNQFSGSSEDQEFNLPNPLKKYAHEAGFYIQDEFDLGDLIKINAGLRYSLFAQMGPFAQYTYDDFGNRLDSVIYQKNDLVKRYGGWEPRINARFKINENNSIKASVAKTYQYIHLVTNNGSTLPTDVWMPSSLLVKPQEAWQYALGYFKNFWNGGIETSVEVYYKKMNHQVEYRAGYTPNTMRDPELDFVYGKGDAYGAEFFVNKTAGKFTGWIGYTLSWTWRYFPELNNGKRFPAKYDRRHDLSLVANYALNDKIDISSVFVFGSGNAITLPTSYYIIEGKVVQEFSDLNAYRIFPYHRLDLSVVYTPKPHSKKRWKSSWAFSIYNVYSRMNPYILYVDAVGNVQEGADVKIKQISIFPVLPSITYNFKF